MDELSFAAPYLRAAAEKRGWEVVLHPDGGFAGQIRFDGQVRYFVRSTFDLNPAGAAHVARDKALTKFYLGRMGYPIIEGKTFFSATLDQYLGAHRGADAARAYAEELGYPVMVKVNTGSSGVGIERATDADELRDALARAFAIEDVVIVEPYKAGLRDYRILVLDDEILLAYERRPFAIIGDGKSTVRELVEAVGDRVVARGRRVFPDMDRVARALKQSGASWDDVPPAGEPLRLVEVANLAQGGTAVEVTNELHPSIVRMALAAVRDMGLRYCGLDLLSEDASREEAVHYILELNSSPTINHFARFCRVGEERLIALHDKLLTAMARRP